MRLPREEIAKIIYNVQDANQFRFYFKAMKLVTEGFNWGMTGLDIYN